MKREYNKPTERQRGNEYTISLFNKFWNSLSINYGVSFGFSHFENLYTSDLRQVPLWIIFQNFFKYIDIPRNWWWLISISCINIKVQLLSYSVLIGRNQSINKRFIIVLKKCRVLWNFILKNSSWIPIFQGEQCWLNHM